MLSLDHGAMIDLVTISFTRPTVHCDATHTRSAVISVESVWPSGIIQTWLSSTFTNSPSYLNYLAEMWGLPPAARIFPPCLPPHRRVLFLHPTSLVGSAHSFLPCNLRQRHRNVNPVPPRSKVKPHSPSGRPSYRGWSPMRTKFQNTTVPSTKSTLLKISSATGFLST